MFPMYLINNTANSKIWLIQIMLNFINKNRILLFSSSHLRSLLITQPASNMWERNALYFVIYVAEYSKQILHQLGTIYQGWEGNTSN